MTAPGLQAPNLLTPNQLRERLADRGYPVFRGDYNLTLVGLRNPKADADRFDDWMGVLYPVARRWHLHWLPATTDPGLYWLREPMNVDGTAVLALGHHSGCWELGHHRNQYPALVQRGPMTVHRDNNRDHQADTDPAATETGLFGINLHRAQANGTTLQVGRWSAGCQVVADSDDFGLVIALARVAARRYGNRFSYSLLEADA